MSGSLVARTVRGLEWAAADEIGARFPSADRIAMSGRQVSFELSALDESVLGLRLVDDLFLAVGTVTEVGPTKDVPAQVAKRIATLDWTGATAALGAVRELPARPRFDVVVSLQGRRNYNRFAMENAVGSALRPVLRGSYQERTAEGRPAGESDLTVRVFVTGTEALAALRLADRPLHRRGYKQDTGAGTLHPPVAAAMVRLTAPAGPETVADPFCGDGTIAIEAALAYPASRVLGGELDPDRLRNARHNAARAGVTLPFVRLDAGRLPWQAGTIDVVVTNPPWNLAVDATGSLQSSLDGFWRRLPELLSGNGRVCVLADAGLDAPEGLRRMGYQFVVVNQIRLAGRVSHLIVCVPAGVDRPGLPAGLARWRRRAVAEGIVTETGF